MSAKTYAKSNNCQEYSQALITITSPKATPESSLHWPKRRPKNAINMRNNSKLLNINTHTYAYILTYSRTFKRRASPNGTRKTAACHNKGEKGRLAVEARLDWPSRRQDIYKTTGRKGPRGREREMGEVMDTG